MENYWADFDVEWCDALDSNSVESIDDDEDCVDDTYQIPIQHDEIPF